MGALKEIDKGQTMLAVPLNYLCMHMHLDNYNGLFIFFYIFFLKLGNVSDPFHTF